MNHNLFLGYIHRHKHFPVFHPDMPVPVYIFMMKSFIRRKFANMFLPIMQVSESRTIVQVKLPDRGY